MPAELLSGLRSDAAATFAGSAAITEAEEANHRIANNLTVVAGLVRLQASEISKAGRTLTPEQVCAVLEEVSGRIETVGEFHRLLANKGSGDVDLSGYLRDVARAAVNSMTLKGEVDLRVAADDDCVIPSGQALSVGLIVSEFVINAVKYAHPASGVRGIVQIGCRAQDGGGHTIWVADDGVGLPDGFDPHRDGGLGMRIVRNLARQLRATLSFESSSLGLIAKLSIRP